jgi:trans-aconitate 2-methyltransferase
MTAPTPDRDPAREWNAESYARVSTPMQGWATTVMDRLPLRGDETVLDAGCGAGIQAAQLLERLPAGRVICLDVSANMLDRARADLASRFGDRVAFVQADLGALDPTALPWPVDAIFSNATFHWVLDHDALVAGLARALRPGGWLVAQCGGAGNLRQVRAIGRAVMASAPFAPCFVGWQEPMYYAAPEETADRLTRAGFTDVRCWLTDAPTPFPDAATTREYFATVNFGRHLARIDDAATREAFLDALVAASAAADPPFTNDYVRLNIVARRGG